MAAHDWPRETPHPFTLQITPSLLFICITFTNPKLYKYLSFSISFHYSLHHFSKAFTITNSSSSPPLQQPLQLLQLLTFIFFLFHLHIHHHKFQNSTKASTFPLPSPKYHHHQNLFTFSLYIFISYGASRIPWISDLSAFLVIQASVLAFFWTFLFQRVFSLSSCFPILSSIRWVFSLATLLLSYFIGYASVLALVSMYFISCSMSFTALYHAWPTLRGRWTLVTCQYHHLIMLSLNTRHDALDFLIITIMGM